MTFMPNSVDFYKTSHCLL